MTTAGSHNDTFAASAHRFFFDNYALKVDPKECPNNMGHKDSIDTLTLAVPVILKYFELPKEEICAKVSEVVAVIRKT